MLAEIFQQQIKLMKYIISVLIVLNISCINKNFSTHTANSKKLLDSLKNETKNSTLLFHHQKQKKSIVEKVYHEKK